MRKHVNRGGRSRRSEKYPMSDQKIHAVTGATGAQGGGLVQAILSDPERRFAVRAITRQPESEKARVLADAGAAVVYGDTDQPAGARAYSSAAAASCCHRCAG